jgi:hypothetical protein
MNFSVALLPLSETNQTKIRLDVLQLYVICTRAISMSKNLLPRLKRAPVAFCGLLKLFYTEGVIDAHDRALLTTPPVLEVLLYRSHLVVAEALSRELINDVLAVIVF